MYSTDLTYHMRTPKVTE